MDSKTALPTQHVERYFFVLVGLLLTLRFAFLRGVTIFMVVQRRAYSHHIHPARRETARTAHGAKIPSSIPALDSVEMIMT